jgi:hypothetical protein
VKDGLRNGILKIVKVIIRKQRNATGACNRLQEIKINEQVTRVKQVFKG